MDIGIYMIINEVTGDFYIGSAAVSLKSRISYHKRDLKANKHHSSRFQNSWNKYGSEAFSFVILKNCQANECIYLEQHYINEFSPVFNMNPIAGNCSGRKFNEESKKKMSESAKKRGLNEFLLKNQENKEIFNNEGLKLCSKGNHFADSTKFRQNCNYCLKCYSQTRPSRSKKLENKCQL